MRGEGSRGPDSFAKAPLCELWGGVTFPLETIRLAQQRHPDTEEGNRLFPRNAEDSPAAYLTSGSHPAPSELGKMPGSSQQH